jgi:hypothetical protein
MKFNLIYFFILFSFNSFGQDPKSINSSGSLRSLTPEELKVACENYKAMFVSDTYKVYLKKSEDFNAKINHLHFDWDPKDSQVFDNWLEQNIHSTQFKSIQEAKADQKALYEANAKVLEENKELYGLMAKATPEQLKEIAQPYFNYFIKRDK